MFVKRPSLPKAPPAPSSALTRIADEAQALRAPTSSLYHACVRERLRAQQADLAALDAALDQARTEGFAAAVRLMSLDAPERVVFNAFTDLSSGKTGTP